MRCLGLVVLLLVRIESLTCPERCICVPQYVSCSNVTNDTELRQLSGSTTTLHLRHAAISLQTLTQLPIILPHLTQLVITNSTVEYSGASKRVVSPQQCDQLETLVLSNSSLTSLPSDLFYSCYCLTSLDLSGNLIENLPAATFHRLVHLISLDLHSNRLKTLDEVTFRYLDALQMLDVSRNQISRVSPTAFQSLAGLVTLNLAGNPLSASGLVLLGGAGRQLKVVDVSYTGLRQAPSTIEQTVTTLEMKGNAMTSVRCGDLDSYALLSSLNLDGNAISSVEDDAMGRMERLTYLILSHNALVQVPKSLPDVLQLLDLSYNAIRNVSKSDFVNLPRLKDLSLGGNPIHTMDVSSLSALVSLKTLDLSRNPLLVLPPLTGLDRLEVLNMAESPGLAHTFLSDTLTLHLLVSLAELRISFANLTALGHDLVNLLPALRVLALDGNPWHCDCTLLVTAQWLRTITTTASNCATPARLKDRSLTSLSPVDFENECDVIHGGNESMSPQELMLRVAPATATPIHDVQSSLQFG